MIESTLSPKRQVQIEGRGELSIGGLPQGCYIQKSGGLCNISKYERGTIRSMCYSGQAVKEKGVHSQRL